MIDEERLNKLKKIFRGKYPDFRQKFLHDSYKLFDELKLGIESDEHRAEAERLVHTLKSNVKNFGSVDCAKLMQEFEDKYRVQDFSSFDSDIQVLEQAFKSFEKELQAMDDA